MRKEEYSELELEIILFEAEDVIMTSYDTDDSDEVILSVFLGGSLFYAPSIPSLYDLREWYII